MTTRLTDSETLVALLGAEGHATRGEHPEIERLLAYHAGELAVDAEARVQDHLVGCRQCARWLLELDSFPDTEAEPEPRDEVVDLATIAAWRDFEREIKEPERNPAHERRGNDRSIPPAQPAWALYAAASLLFGVVGLSVWVAQLRGVNTSLHQTVDQLSKPRVNPPSFRVEEARRSQGPAAVVIDLRPDDLFFELDIEPPAQFPTYEIEMVEIEGPSILRQGPFESSSSGWLKLLLSQQSVGEGDYRMQVWGSDGERRDLLIERQLQIRYR